MCKLLRFLVSVFFGLFLAQYVKAQSVYTTPYLITTLAGGVTGYSDGTGAAASFIYPKGIAVDSASNAYVADTQSNTIRKITQSGVVTTLAGSAAYVGSADGAGALARFNGPTGIAVDSAGNVYTCDTLNFTVRKITPAGVVSTVAGITGLQKAVDGTGTSAGFNYPVGMTIDSSGNLYVCEPYVNLIRKITPAGVVTTINLSSTIYPQFIAIDTSGNFYVTCINSYVIYKVTSTGLVSLLAGTTGSQGNADGESTAAQFGIPYGISVDASGSVFVSDQKNETIRKISNGIVSTIAGQNLISISPFTNGTGSAATFSNLYGLAIDNSNKIYIGDIGSIRVGQVASPPVINSQPMSTSQSVGYSATLSVSATGVGTLSYQWYKNGAAIVGATSSSLTFSSLSLTDSGTYSVTISNTYGSVTSTAVMESVTSGYSFSTYLNSAGLFNSAWGIAIDSQGNLYLTDTSENCIIKINTNKTISVFAGSQNYAGFVDGVGVNARFNQPYGIAIDQSGNLYVSEMGNHSIRKITSTGLVSTLAGSSTPGSQDGVGINARFSSPAGVAVDSFGNVYVADMGLAVIKEITPAGIVTTIAGAAYNYGSLNGQGSAARFNNPAGIAVDGIGNIYVADTGNNILRKINSSGLVSTLAGTAGMGGGTDGVGSNALFAGINGLAVDSSGTIFATDSTNQTIKKITSLGVVSTIAGSALQAGLVNGVGSVNRFNGPYGIAVDSLGNLFIYENANQDIRFGNVMSIPSQPTNVTATAGDSQAVVSFNPPAINGGSSILNYTIIANPSIGNGIITTNANQTQVNVLGLNNGVSYTFSVTATNSIGTSLSSVVSSPVTPMAPVTISAPQSQTVYVGSSVTFAPTITGTPPISYQWVFNGVNILGANSATYTISSVSLANAGSYYLRGTNSVSQTGGALANLTVIPISTPGQPTNLSTVVGNGSATVTFTAPTSNGGSVITSYNVTATPTSGGTAIVANGVNSSITVSGLVSGYSYTFTVSANNSVGTGSPSVATQPIIIGAEIPAITTQPQSVLNAIGSTVSFTVVSTGTPSPAYQWFFNGSPINGAISSTYIINSVQATNSGNYYVVVSNSAGSTTSSTANLSISTPIITSMSPSIWVPNYNTGLWPALTVTANNASTYQWYHNGVVIPSATSSSYYLPATAGFVETNFVNVEKSAGWNSSGWYNVVVTNNNVSPAVSTVSPIIYVTNPPCNVYGWGDNSLGQLNIPANLTNVVQLASGNGFNLALKSDGTLVSWGTSTTGVLSIPSGLTNVVKISANYYSAIALKSDGTVVSWGKFAAGGAIAAPPSYVTNIVDIAAGPDSQYAVKSDGNLVSWGGTNYDGKKVLSGTVSDYSIPLGLNGIVSVVYNGEVVMALKSNGSVVTWGQLDFGEGNIPSAATNIISISAGISTCYALRSDGNVVAWGNSMGNYNLTTVPSGLSGVVSISAGTNSCSAIKSDGTVVSWGSNYYTQNNTPSGLATAIQVSVGNGNTMILYAPGNDSAPTLVTQPISQSAGLGASVTFTSNAQPSFPPPKYQWYYNDVAVGGATSSTLTLSNITTNNYGIYTVSASNYLGSATSANASLNLNSAPIITSQPQSVILQDTGAVTFSVSAIGATSYQWYWSGPATNYVASPLTGNLSSYTLPSASIYAGTYYVTVSNSNGAVTSSPAYYTCNPVLSGPQNFAQLDANNIVTNVIVISSATTQTPPFNAYTLIETNSTGLHGPPAGIGYTWNPATQSFSAPVAQNVAPSIITAPVSQTTSTGATVTFSVTASGTAPITDQWYFNNSQIAGATNANFTLNSVSTLNSGSYSVKVTNNIGTVTSNAAVLNVIPNVPLITSASSVTSNVGNVFTFQVTATNSPTSYSTLSDLPAGLSLNTGTGLISGIPSVAGTYVITIIVANAGGSSVQNISLTFLTTYQSPAIITQPFSQLVNVGGNVTFSANATGNPLPTFQWYFNGSIISGATSTSYNIASVSTSNAGSYDIVATNSVASVTSNFAVLTVNSLSGSPVISIQPLSQIINTGSALYLSVTASGQSLVYQWYLNGAAINGATLSTYSVPSVSASNAGSYTCVISSSLSSVTTSPAIISVNPVAPLILIQPLSQSIQSGSSVTLTVSIIGLSPTYQWYLNGIAIAGAKYATYTIPAVNLGTAGAYTVKITNGGGSITSNTAYISSIGNPGRLVNLSVLSMDGPGSQLLTVGFTNGGAGTLGSQSLLVRASGPALSDFSVSPVLPDPILSVFSGQTVVATNDNWGTPVSNGSAVIAADAATGAFALANSLSLDAALLQSLPVVNGGYTVQIAGKGSSTGFAMAEVYDASPVGTYVGTMPRLINVSCLEKIPTGGALTAGFIIGGDSTEKVLIRVSGPTLAAAPLNVQGTIADPKLTVFNGSSKIVATNSGWGGDSNITAANSATGAFQFINASSKDSAVILTLAPGLYSVQATSASGTAGVTLIEVYEVPAN